MKLSKKLIQFNSSIKKPPTMNDLIKNMEKPSNITTKQFNDIKKNLKENPKLGFNALQMVLQYSRNQYGGTGWSSYFPSLNYFTGPKKEEQDNNINNNINSEFEKTRMNIASSVKEKGRKTRRTMVPSKIQNQYRKNSVKRSTKNNVHYWGNYLQYVSPKPLFSNNPEYGSQAPLGITYQQPQPINPPSLQGSLLLGAILLGAYDKYYRTPNKKTKKPLPSKSSPKSTSKKPSPPKSRSKKPSQPKSVYKQVSFPKIKTKMKTIKKL